MGRLLAAGAPATCTTLMSIVAEGFMETLLYVNPHIIPRSSKKHALLHIVMLMMIQPVFSLAQALIILSHSAQPGLPSIIFKY
jgi:hypothetical protein